MAFLNTDISRGRVATCLKFGGIFNYAFIAELLLSVKVKEFFKSAKGFIKLVIIWQRYGQ